ncbi:MAG: hypothetical protein H0Z34_01350 [Brevibacillus sp.]|nr:hypothetical protein [Brevibacillus sp.]
MGEQPESWQKTLQECVVFGVLFKALMADLSALKKLPLKLSYHLLFEELSRWAEQRHHQLRRRLREQGCILVNSERLDQFYRIELKYGGYLQEALYSIELVRAECEQQIRIWLMQRGGKSW